MKTQYLCFFVALLAAAHSYGQVGIGTTTPSSHAVLELRSPGNNQGFLVPRLTTSERNAMSLTASDNGLMVYDSDDQKFYYWQTAQWLPLQSGMDGDGDATNEIQQLQLNGNTLTISNDPSGIPIDLAPFAGTNTDNQTLSFNAATGQLTISGSNDVETITLTGNNILGAVNDASTTAVVNANRLSGTVVLDSEAPAAGAIAGNFSSGLSINDNAVTTLKINNAAVTMAKIADGAVTTAKIQNNQVTPAKVAPSVTNGQVLTTVAGAAAWADIPTLIGGTLTSISAGTGLEGGTITTTGTISIAADGVSATELRDDASVDANRAVTTNHIRNRAITDTKLSLTGVTAATYGTATTVPRLTIDAQGRVTAATSVSISAGSTAGLGETLAVSTDAKAQPAVNLSAVSINMATTPGALNVNGSHFVSFTTFAGTYDVLKDDYLLISDASKGGSTVVLPPAGENMGRILIIRSSGTSTANAVTVSSKTDLLDGFPDSEPLYSEVNFSANVAYSITVISTGTTWITISRSIASTFNKG